MSTIEKESIAAKYYTAAGKLIVIRNHKMPMGTWERLKWEGEEIGGLGIIPPKAEYVIFTNKATGEEYEYSC